MNKIMQVYLNGSWINQEKACVPVSDRGFVFGDGVYEVIRAVDGHLFREKEHLERLNEGLQALQIRPASGVTEQIPEAGREILQRNGLLSGEATVYIQITRGSAVQRTHTFPHPPVQATLYMSAAPFAPYTELHENGVDVITVPDVRWLRCNLKTIQLLPNTLARQRAVDAGVNSALMIRDGMVTESPNANIFGVRNGTLYTFPLSNYILSGITRRLVMELAGELQIPVKTIPVSEEDIFSLDELFFTGTTTDIQPVTEVNGRPLADGRPGPVTRAIQQAYRKELYT